MVGGLLAAGLIAAAGSAQAGINSAMVPVRDAGNLPDSTGYGAVSYNYNIGQYDVTLGQYTAFLNAVATKSDPYGLYTSYMASGSGTSGIEQSGSPGNFSYSVTGSAPGSEQYAGIRCFLGWCGAVLQLVAKRPADERHRMRRHN